MNQVSKKINIIFRDIPEIETNRLVLRKLSRKDVYDMYEYCSDEEITKYVTWDTHKSIADTRIFLSSVLEQYESGDVSPWGIMLKSNMKIIGTIGFHWWDTYHNNAEFGYVISRKYWNLGLTTEAASDVIKFGFSRMLLNRVQAMVRPENKASIKVLEKCKMTQEGLLREPLLVKGKYRSFYLYSIIKSDFFGNNL